ncbi:MAG: NAD(P)/FAD-dependent oxidoreductase [Candidatus Aenigmarchaeota archaeon]|nr:NAD(P)/FAD-dependent oxidoreductase [Candidatus Aenigmarchaeota archaeon]
MKIPIAIVGGGPAGAHLGYCLASEGIKATIFDDSHPREKPCGGGISALALKKFTLLHGLHYDDNDDWLKLVSPGGKEALVTGDEETSAFSRKRMDMFILHKAIDAGSNLVEERVVDFERSGDSWKIKTNKKTYEAEVLVGADGVNSLVRRKLIGPIPKEHLGVCLGVFAKSPRHAEEMTTIQFLKGMEGYAWFFPREEDISIGVGTVLENGKHLKAELDKFMKKYASHTKVLSTWAAMLPMPKDEGFLQLPTSGEDWLLIGDAAGHVDPMMGAGITYAMWGAELAAKAIASGDIASYERMWREEYGHYIREGIKMRNLLSHKTILEIFIRLSARSRTFGNVMCGLVDSEQDYRTVWKVILKSAPRILYELI